MSRDLTFILAFGTILIIYGAINYYIGLRGWQTVGRTIPWLNSKVYWLVFTFLAFSYVLARLVVHLLPVVLQKGFLLIGAYWMAAFYYLVIIIVIIDLIRLMDRWLHFLPTALKANGSMVGWAVLLFVVGLLAYGTWNAINPVVTRYEVTIPKSAGQVKQLHAVMVSDIHLGMIVDNKRLSQMVNLIQKIDPDIVFMPGDIIDESVEPYIEQKMADTFKRLQPPLGVYAVRGNHEHIGEDGDDAIRYLSEGGVKVLVDSYVKVNDSFYLVGRDDPGHGRKQRKALADILTGIDSSLPIIMLDHQPSALDEAEEQGVDLLFSGHTHQGQFFPNNLVTDKMYEEDWGYLRKGSMQLIVSLGFGTWGPPVRIGNRPEIVEVNIKFVP